MKKTVFFTESNFIGKIPRDFQNMRVEYAWQCILNSDHYPIHEIVSGNILKQYNLAIIILPKTGLDKYLKYDLVELAHNYSDQVAYQQEGPNWGFQDLPMDQQIWYYNTLMSVDMIFCHNESDVSYYRGLTGKRVEIMRSLMITDDVKSPGLRSDKVIIGGNMCSWYSGFDSWVIAQEFDLPIYAPSMGRKILREDELDITHLPYMNWMEWMTELSTHRIGVHLMRTHAAGTFALNCAYWKIPCIGFKNLDTQEILHPLTTVNLDDLEHAREIANKLKNPEFYKLCQDTIEKRYNQHYTERVWKERWKEIEKSL